MLPHLNNYFGKYKAIIMMAKTTKLRLIKDKSSKKFSSPNTVVFQLRFVFACFEPPLFTQCCSIPLSLGPSIVPWTRLLGTNLVFLSPPLSASACIWTVSPQKTLNLHLTRRVQQIAVSLYSEYRALLSCAVRRMQACTRLWSLIEAGSYFTAIKDLWLPL